MKHYPNESEQTTSDNWKVIMFFVTITLDAVLIVVFIHWLQQTPSLGLKTALISSALITQLTSTMLSVIKFSTDRELVHLLKKVLSLVITVLTFMVLVLFFIVAFLF